MSARQRQEEAEAEPQVEKKNALTFLMQQQSSAAAASSSSSASKNKRRGSKSNYNSSNRKRKSSSSIGTRFVLCPAGCGKHIAETSINLHLDKCIQEQEAQKDDLTLTTKKKENSGNDSINESSGTTSPNTKESEENKSPLKASPSVTQAEEEERHHQDSTTILDSNAVLALSSSSITPGDNQQEDTGVIVADSKQNATLTATVTGTRVTPTQQEVCGPTIPKPTSAAAADATTAAAAAAAASSTNKRGTNNNNKNNIFSLMMERSKVVFAGDKNPLQQCVHLSDDGTVTFYQGADRPNNNDGSHHHHVAWSSKLTMRDRCCSQQQGVDTKRQQQEQRCPVELTVSTSQNPGELTRLCMRHSRLSVPVLKSILQKAVRRRKPLPAVRVAMELADKSLGDLLRRLPIIVLEDSTLHPQLPFLVWLMIAESKGFRVPKRLVVVVMRIVYEIASCQWSDSLPNIAADGDPAATNDDEDTVLSLNSLGSGLGEVTNTNGMPVHDDGRTIIWSILARAEYGGMKGDIRMLYEYGCLWQKRFRESVPKELVSRITMRQCSASSTKTTTTTTTTTTDHNTTDDAREEERMVWLQVPAHIHARARVQSNARVTSLCQKGLEKLCIEDVCVQGVDFHCSSIVDHLLSLPFSGVCYDLLLLSSSGCGQGEEFPTSPEGRRSFLERIYKHCMWHFSSGINCRQPLLPPPPSMEEGDHNNPRYEGLWNDLIAKEAIVFQTNYVNQRLAR